MPRITKRSVKPTPEPTVTESDVTIMEAPEHVESDSSSTASVALPIPSKPSSRRSSSHSESEEKAAEESESSESESESESEPEPEPELPAEPTPELQERIDYIHYLIETEDEEMLERMLNLIRAHSYGLEEQAGWIRSALAELNRRYVAECQHEWAEERAAVLAAEQAAIEAAERAVIEAEEKRIRDEELAQLAELQAKYCKKEERSSSYKFFTAAWAAVCVATSLYCLK